MLINPTSLHKIFAQPDDKYSQQLRKLVNTTDGPVRAHFASPTNIAGLFSVRIANLLSVSKILPENILCFMTTDSSVNSVKMELTHLMAAGVAMASIHTLQSFCEKIVKSQVAPHHNNHPKLISSLETVQLLKELIAAFPTKHPLKRYRADVYHEISHLKTLFAFIKQEGYTTELLLQQMDAIRNQLLAGEAPQLNFKSLPMGEAFATIDQLEAGINEFNHWQKLLKKQNRYDADDLVAMAIQTLEADKQLLSTYQHQFQYIQIAPQTFSSNPANKLLKLLVGENKYPNILLTKYDCEPMDGSLYADVENVLLFNWIEIKPEPEINHLQLAKKLHLPTITSYQSVEATIAGVANKVLALLQQNVAPNRVAIAATGDGYNKKLEEIFTKKNIPFFYNRTVALFQEPFIKKIIQLLRYTSTEMDMPFSGDDLLFEILHYDFFQVPPIEIAKLSVEVNSKKYGDNPTSIRKLLQQKTIAPAKDLFDTGMDKDLKKVSAILEKLIQDAAGIRVDQLLENTLQHAGLLIYADKSDDRSWLMQLLNAWTGFVEKEIIQNPELQLNQLIAALDTLQAQVEYFPVTIERTTGNTEDVQIMQPAADCWAPEFDYLFVIAATDSTPNKNNWIHWLDQLPPATARSFQKMRTKNHHRFLNQVLFATPNGAVFFSKYNSKGIACEPPNFIAKILSQHALPVIEATELKLEKTIVRPQIASLEAAFIAPIVNKFVMNVSALNSYLNCPLGFYYTNILRIPNGKSEALEFGSAIHYALEQLFKKMADGYDSNTAKAKRIAAFPSPTEMTADFKLYMYRQRANFTGEAFERRMAYGEDVLRNYYAQYINSWNKVVSVERNIRGVTVNDVPLKGKLDKLEFTGKDVTIVDYKSGNIEKALLKTNPPNADDPNGGDYWRQAVFYKILVDHYKSKAWKVVATEFDFIEPDKSGQFRKVQIEIDAPDIETVTQQLTATWHKIQVHDFYTGCGRLHCHWCNFVKENRLAIAMHQSSDDQASH